MSLNKTALVTGANKGIGFAICQGLLYKGFDVFLTARDINKGKEAIAKLAALKDTASHKARGNVAGVPPFEDKPPVVPKGYRKHKP